MGAHAAGQRAAGVPRHGGAALPLQRPPRGQRLHAADEPAGAPVPAAGVHDEVAELRAEAARAAHEPPVHDEAAAQAGADREEQDALPGEGARGVRPGGGVGVVVHDDGQPAAALQVAAQLDAAVAVVGREVGRALGPAHAPTSLPMAGRRLIACTLAVDPRSMSPRSPRSAGGGRWSPDDPPAAPRRPPRRHRAAPVPAAAVHLGALAHEAVAALGPLPGRRGSAASHGDGSGGGGAGGELGARRGRPPAATPVQTIVTRSTTKTSAPAGYPGGGSTP